MTYTNMTICLLNNKCSIEVFPLNKIWTKHQETRTSLSVVVWHYMAPLPLPDKTYNAAGLVVTSISTRKYDTVQKKTKQSGSIWHLLLVSKVSALPACHISARSSGTPCQRPEEFPLQTNWTPSAPPRTGLDFRPMAMAMPPIVLWQGGGGLDEPDD